MKKNLLFGLLSILVAGFGFGGVGMACEENEVAQSDLGCYTSLTAAISGANDGDVVTLLKDIDSDTIVEINKSIILDLGGKTLKGRIFTTTEGVNATIKNGTIDASTVSGKSAGAIRIQGNATFTLEDTLNVTNVEMGLVVTHGGTLIVEGGTYTTSDNCVIGTNGTSGIGNNTITINGGTFNGNISSATYVACGIYVANNDIVTVNGGTFNIDGGAGIVSRGGTTILGENASFNFTYTNIPFGTLGKVGDSNITVPAGYELVMDIQANYPGSKNSNTFVTTNNLTGTYIRLANPYVVSIKDGDSYIPLTLTKDGENLAAKITKPEDPTKDGYAFSGWFNGEDTTAYDFTTAVASNVDMNAKWNVKQYTITFNTEGGSAIAAITQDYGTTVTAPANPTKDGYTFAGWDKNIPATMPAENLIIKAKWNVKSSGSTGGGGGGSYVSFIKEESKVETGSNKEEINLGGEVKDESSTTGEVSNEGNNSDVIISDAAKNAYDNEQIEAYKWAYKNGITTINDAEKARLSDPLTRAELAKMMSQYISSVLKKTPIKTDIPQYSDVDDTLGDLTGYIVKAYQYQIMGINADGSALEYFNPNGLVSRAEFATVFSRVLYGNKNNTEGEDFYSKHIEALKTAGILTNDDPTIQEVRGWVMLMMYRSAKTTEEAKPESANEEAVATTGNTVTIANPASTYCVEQGGELTIKTADDGSQYGMCKLKDGSEVEEWEYFRANHKDEAATGAVAETSTGALAEAATGTTAEITTGTTVEAATGAVATTGAAE